MVFVCVLLFGAVVAYVWEKIPPDQTAFTVFAILLTVASVSGSPLLPNSEALIAVLANPAPLTIACMFILSAALEKCGVIDRLVLILRRTANLSYRRFLLVLILPVAFASAFINNTPVVVILMPVVISLARDMRIAGSKFLIPLSYASILGGTCTLLGTSTNLIANGLLPTYNQPGLGLFELSRIGLPLLGVGTLYLLVFGRRFLPDRPTLTSILSDEERREYLTEAFVPPHSDLVGKRFGQVSGLKHRGIRLVEVVRNGVALPGPVKMVEFQAGDRLVLACRPSGMVEAHSVEDLTFITPDETGLAPITAQRGSIVEGVIGPASDLAGTPLRSINFRQRYRMVVIAIHRKGRNLRDELDSLVLQPGDNLLLMGPDEAIERLRNGDEIFLLDRPPIPAESKRRKGRYALGAILGVVALASFEIVPIHVATVIGVAFLFATGCVNPKEAYRSVDWGILVLIYGMLGLGLALGTTGTSERIATGLIGTVVGSFPPEIQPWIALGFLFLTTSLLTELLSNNATVVLMVPIGIEIAFGLGVDPRPFIIAACIASSASFATPIGYQTNTYVYGVGGYRFADFLKFGAPLNLIVFATSTILIPLIWPFQANG